MNNSELDKLKQWISEAENIVFLGGAGVSTASGIPDFRSRDGLYALKYKYPPERILSYSFFMSNPAVFYEFYREKILLEGIKPNAAHHALARLERRGALKAVITQNIDGLHQAAGSQNVIELHGTSARNYCVACGKEHSYESVKNSAGIPRCGCGAVIRPDVVLYEEALDQSKLAAAVKAIRAADMMIVGGTSLTVYPAAGLTEYFSGNKLAVINKDDTDKQLNADIVIRADIAATLAYAVD